MNTDEVKGTLLISLARAAIEAELGTNTLDRPGEPWLDESAATFVTLEKKDQLRGCIGTIEPFRSLFDDVTDNARAAAFRDPRFQPVRVDEWPSICVEVSVLTPLTELVVGSEQELFEKLEPTIHGLVLKQGYRQATFLPSVWDQLPEPRDFVAQLKKKAGIAPSHWSDDMLVFTYTVDKYAEESSSG